MMEPAELPPMQDIATKRPEWALTGANGRDPNVISSINMGAQNLETYNLHLQSKLKEIEQASELRYEAHQLDDADFAIIAFGTASRASPNRRQNAQGVRFKRRAFPPDHSLAVSREATFRAGRRVKGILVVEMNAGPDAA